MSFDATKVPEEYADLFHHGDNGRGLTDEEWDAQKARMREAGNFPLDNEEE